jgi:hypothetical protein
MKNVLHILVVVVFLALMGKARAAETNASGFSILITMPYRSEPVLFGANEFPLEKWKSKSAATFPWFVEMKTEKKSGWYVDWDAERGEITHFVVHHTAGPESQTAEIISDFHKGSLYAPVYQDAKSTSPYVYGLPMHSGHVVDGKETFIAYHFLIFSDGHFQTTLVPHRDVEGKLWVDMIGWGAGKWSVNCHAVQVALVGSFEKTPPPKAMLVTLDNLVGFYQSKVPHLIVASHKEVRPKPTECPGEWFAEWAKKYRK